MKLNPDCVRDVLLYLEENLKFSKERDYGIEHESIGLTTIVEYLQNEKGYEPDDVKYSVEKLLEIRYIVSYKMTTGNNHSIVTCPISDITYEGHQFLNTIRPDTVWQATKKGASKLGIMSMHALSSIAMKVAEVIISDPTVIAKIVSML